MNKLHMNIAEFLRIRGGEVFGVPDKTVLQKIIEGHLLPLNEVREKLALSLYVQAGYRPKEYELRQGRPGTSQHCYEGLGATDITCADNAKLLGCLIDSPFKRICWYPENNFFHVDYNAESRQYFVNWNDGDGWSNSNLDELRKVVK